MSESRTEKGIAGSTRNEKKVSLRNEAENEFLWETNRATNAWGNEWEIPIKGKPTNAE